LDVLVLVLVSVVRALVHLRHRCHYPRHAPVNPGLMSRR
jgi:hypothetical protein